MVANAYSPLDARWWANTLRLVILGNDYKQQRNGRQNENEI
jgi:hypothetical protein